MDIKLDNNLDLELTNNSFTLLEGFDAVRQHIEIRLRTFLGEWYLDTRIGMPYFEEFLIKNPNQLVMQARLREAIEETPGVASVNSIDFELDSTARTLSVDITGALDGDTDFQFTFNELIIGD